MNNQSAPRGHMHIDFYGETPLDFVAVRGKVAIRTKPRSYGELLFSNRPSPHLVDGR